MSLCDYGCGQEAHYQMKNGKWCCSKSWNKCFGYKKKISRDSERRYDTCSICGIKMHKANIKRHENICKNKKTCLYCGKVLELNKRRNDFCNHTCAGFYVNQHSANLKNSDRGPFTNNRASVKECPICKKIFKSINDFCCYACKKESIYINNIKRWLSGEIDGVSGSSHASYVKRYIIERDGEKCSICGWAEVHPKTNKIPICLHHIDGNWKNNDLSNLCLLCPNHHSLSDTYGSLNNGKGRPRYNKKVN